MLVHKSNNFNAKSKCNNDKGSENYKLKKKDWNNNNKNNDKKY